MELATRSKSAKEGRPGSSIRERPSSSIIWGRLYVKTLFNSTY